VTNVSERISARIRARGAITFAEFMEMALFDREDGYYTTHATLGHQGDYLTSSDLGPAFARSFARGLADLWGQLRKPSTWDVVEAGAGRGTLMRDLLAALERERPEAARGARASIVEVSPRMRAHQSVVLDGRDVRWASDIRNLAPIHGVVFANEVLDAFPVHVLVRTAQGVREVFVTQTGGSFSETLRPPSRPDLRWRMPDAIPIGSRWEVSPGAEGWVASVGAALVSGYFVLVDYGGEESELLTREGAGTVRGFARHRMITDPFADPGRTDLTASVNFTAMRLAAQGAGMRFVGIATQRDVLTALGIREVAVHATTPVDQLRAASRRSAVETLLDPNGFGAFKVACFAKDARVDGLRLFASGEQARAR
jgi:SAM-dependent MidA family methyltransferase